MDNLELIKSVTEQHLDDDESNWFQQKLTKLEEDTSPRALYMAFATVPRFVSRNEMEFNAMEIQALTKVYPGFENSRWTKDEFCRLAFILHIPVDTNKTILENLFQTADLRELEVLYKCLFFLDNASEFSRRAEEGVRSSMQNVFDAVTLNNPFASRYMGEDGWNQMVLKAVFMQRPLYQIVGIGEKANSKLASILSDYAHERWAAKRVITPELWRMMSGFVDERLFADLKRVIETDTPLAKEAAVKAIEESDYQPAKDWLSTNKIQASVHSWKEIGEQTEKTLI
ncbi:MAG: EboA domain-containing protein [Cyclobacteriaceae bacterium]|nr:EboA domain-containing protein [Cyclobacteriaceae bacterium]